MTLTSEDSEYHRRLRQHIIRLLKIDPKNETDLAQVLLDSSITNSKYENKKCTSELQAREFSEELKL